MAFSLSIHQLHHTHYPFLCTYRYLFHALSILLIPLLLYYTLIHKIQPWVENRHIMSSPVVLEAVPQLPEGFCAFSVPKMALVPFPYCRPISSVKAHFSTTMLKINVSVVILIRCERGSGILLRSPTRITPTLYQSVYVRLCVGVADSAE